MATSIVTVHLGPGDRIEVNGTGDLSFLELGDTVVVDTQASLLPRAAADVWREIAAAASRIADEIDSEIAALIRATHHEAVATAPAGAPEVSE